MQVKAEKTLWENRANQILKRKEVRQEESENADDADLPDGAGANDIRDSGNEVDRERT